MYRPKKISDCRKNVKIVIDIHTALPYNIIKEQEGRNDDDN